MQPGKVIGRVVADKKYPALKGSTLLLVQPTDWKGTESGDPLVALDSVGAGAGEFVFYVQAREAAIVKENVPPVDASIVAIIDGVDLEEP